MMRWIAQLNSCSFEWFSAKKKFICVSLKVIENYILPIRISSTIREPHFLCLNTNITRWMVPVGRWCWITFIAGESYLLDNCRARVYCACSRCGRVFGWIIFSHVSFLLSCSYCLGDCSIQTEILSERAVKPKTTSQPTNNHDTIWCIFLQLDWKIWAKVHFV